MLGLVTLCHGDMLRSTFTASTSTVEAGEAITFKIVTTFEPGYPAELDDDEVCKKSVIFRGYLG